VEFHKSEYKVDAKSFSWLVCDLSSLKSIKEGATSWLEKGEKLDILINNAGIMAVAERAATQDGFEKQMGVNHIGHFYLTQLLLPRLIQSKPSRIINVSSRAHRYANVAFLSNDSLENDFYDKWVGYGNSKFANIIHAYELNERYSSQGVNAYSLHPGVIWTNLGRDFDWFTIVLFIRWLPHMKSHTQGSSTTVYVALKAPLSEAGSYYEDCNTLEMATPSTQEALKNSALRKKFWDVSENFIHSKTSSWK